MAGVWKTVRSIRFCKYKRRKARKVDKRGYSNNRNLNFFFRGSLNHLFSFHPSPSPVLPHFFAPQEIRQQVQFSTPTVPAAHQDSSKGKSSLKLQTGPFRRQKQLLHAWAPRLERLKGAYNKVHTAIWNEIYENFKSSWGESERTVPQVKKRQENLEYEFEQLKVKASKTGQEGLNKIKESFPYYNIFDQTMGYRDSVDPTKMKIESSSFMPSASNADSTPQIISSGAKEREESPVNEDWFSTSAGVKRGCQEVRGQESRKRKRGKSDEANGTDDLGALKEMWEKSLQQENERFEKSMKMFQENQKIQMEQTGSLFTDLKI